MKYSKKYRLTFKSDLWIVIIQPKYTFGSKRLHINTNLWSGLKNKKRLKIIEKLSQVHTASKDALAELIDNISDSELEFLRQKAQKTAQKHFGNKIFVRGLIEFSSFCKNDCLYCGLRCSNLNPKRYRITEDEILECCRNGYELGFRTFVLQSGEDLFFTDNMICSILKKIKI